MRTTVNIDEHLLEAARQLTVRTHRRLGDVVDDALRLLLARSEEGATATLDLPTYGGSGLRPGVDLEDKEGLDALLEESVERAAG
jgi:Bacterial antitoxin of type II TA system, VapB